MWNVETLIQPRPVQQNDDELAFLFYSCPADTDSSPGGLAWNPKRPGSLLSGANDSLVCLWDIAGKPYGGKELQPVSEVLLSIRI